MHVPLHSSPSPASAAKGVPPALIESRWHDGHSLQDPPERSACCASSAHIDASSGLDPRLHTKARNPNPLRRLQSNKCLWCVLNIPIPGPVFHGAAPAPTTPIGRCLSETPLPLTPSAANTIVRRSAFAPMFQCANLHRFALYLARPPQLPPALDSCFYCCQNASSTAPTATPAPSMTSTPATANKSILLPNPS